MHADAPTTPLDIPAWLTRYLDSKHVHYRLRFHSPTRDAAETADVEHVTGSWFANVRVLTDGHRTALFVMPAYAELDLARAKTLVGRPHLRIATREEAQRLFPSIEPDVIPPLRLWPHVDVWMDPSLRHEGPLLFAAATHRAAIEMDFDDWKRIASPMVGRFVEPSFIGA